MHEYEVGGLRGQLRSGLVESKVDTSLLLRRAQLTQELEDVNNAIAALEQNPQILEILNLLRRVGF